MTPLSPRSLLTVLRTPGWRRSVLLRRALALVLLLAALTLALRDAGSTEPRALVFTRPIPPGEAVSRDDVRLVRVPGHLLPESVVQDPSDVEGRVVAAGTEAGELVMTSRFVGNELSENAVGNITTLVPLRLAEPEILPLLHHGDTINVITSGSDRADTDIIATGGRVILSDFRESPGTLLVGLSEEDAHRVAAASLDTPLAVVLVPPLPT